MQKRLICPPRRRQVPTQFSWIDHRLVRNHHVERCSVEALALYLCLITVADLVAFEAPLYQVLSLEGGERR